MGEASRPRHRPTPPHRDLPPPTAREKLHVPDPDLTAVTLADAHLLGGPEFVAQVREDATAVADELAPIGPQGEPVHRESAWNGAAWTLVDAARTAPVGQAVPTARGGAWTDRFRRLAGCGSPASRPPTPWPAERCPRPAGPRRFPPS
jgi:hypothetical protein